MTTTKFKPDSIERWAIDLMRKGATVEFDDSCDGWQLVCRVKSEVRYYDITNSSFARLVGYDVIRSKPEAPKVYVLASDWQEGDL